MTPSEFEGIIRDSALPIPGLAELVYDYAKVVWESNEFEADALKVTQAISPEMSPQEFTMLCATKNYRLFQGGRLGYTAIEGSIYRRNFPLLQWLLNQPSGLSGEDAMHRTLFDDDFVEFREYEDLKMPLDRFPSPRLHDVRGRCLVTLAERILADSPELLCRVLDVLKAHRIYRCEQWREDSRTRAQKRRPRAAN